jgi:putative hydrolase of the HAD superfamily
MIKIALLDADGVVIEARKRFFSERLMADYGITKEQAMQFVHEVIIPSMTSQVDVREVLPHYIALWKVPLDVDQLLTYWWNGENTITQEVVKMVDELRANGVHVYLATDQEKYRAEYIMNELALNDHFDGAFFSYSLLYSKNEKEYWKLVIKQLGVNPNEIVFWDDDVKNVEIASESGITSHTYTTVDKLREEVSEALRETKLNNQ